MAHQELPKVETGSCDHSKLSTHSLGKLGLRRKLLTVMEGSRIFPPCAADARLSGVTAITVMSKFPAYQFIGNTRLAVGAREPR